MSGKQIRGLIAISLILAVIPFICLFSNIFIQPTIPVLADQHDNNLAIEFKDKDIGKGVYFVKPGNSVNELLELIGSDIRLENDFMLGNGMKLTADPASTTHILITSINNPQRLALGMPIDLNLASTDDLLLIPGIGEATAQKILLLRLQKGRFKKIEELMEVKGIKEKKLEKFKQYLYLQE